MSAPTARTSIRRCCARWTPSHATIAGVRSWTIRASSAAGVIVPTAFDARVNATTLVRSESAASNDAGSSVASSSRMSTHRTVAPASSAASTQGLTLASWSSRVTTTSSPGPSVRATEREMANSSVVAFGPKTTSSASALRSAAARWASAITSSVSWLVANAPCVLLLLRQVRRHRLDHGFGDLRAAGRVDEEAGPVRRAAGSAREPAASAAGTSCGHGGIHSRIERRSGKSDTRQGVSPCGSVWTSRSTSCLGRDSSRAPRLAEDAGLDGVWSSTTSRRSTATRGARASRPGRCWPASRGRPRRCGSARSSPA